MTSLASDPATFAEAESRLASLDYAAGRVARSPQATRRRACARAEPRTGARPEGAVAHDGEPSSTRRSTVAKAAVAADPESATAQFALAVVHDRRREVADATKSYNEVLRLNPRAAAAQVALSRLSLSIRRRHSGPAVRRMTRQAEDPSSLGARVALARSLVAARNWTRAETEIAELLKRGAERAAVARRQRNAPREQGEHCGGERAFVSSGPRALARLPRGLGRAYLPRPEGQDPARAIARLEPEIVKQPGSAPLLALLAQAHSAAGDDAKAEQALRRAVSVDPRFTTGYTMLAQLYMQQRRLDEARAEFEGMVKRDPSAVGARTMVGMLFEAQGRRDEARKSYEATVSRRGRTDRGKQPRVHLRRAGHQSRRRPSARDVGETAASRRSQRRRYDRVGLLQEGPAVAGRPAARRQPQASCRTLPRCCITWA